MKKYIKNPHYVQGQRHQEVKHHASQLKFRFLNYKLLHKRRDMRQMLITYVFFSIDVRFFTIKIQTALISKFNENNQLEEAF